MKLCKFIAFLFLPALGLIATGCFPYRATTRMGVSGIAVDANTHSALAGARISFEYCCSNVPPVAISEADGSFNLPKEKRWRVQILNEDSYFLALLIGGKVCISHEGYETNEIYVQPEDERHHFHTKTNLGAVFLKPLPKTLCTTSISTIRPVTYLLTPQLLVWYKKGHHN